VADDDGGSGVDGVDGVGDGTGAVAGDGWVLDSGVRPGRAAAVVVVVVVVVVVAALVTGSSVTVPARSSEHAASSPPIAALPAARMRVRREYTTNV
jgi:hypothetical protein